MLPCSLSCCHSSLLLLLQRTQAMLLPYRLNEM
jgi:hypothetical protein